MIKSITLKNLKGISETYRLGGGISWIYGNNGAGKTAILDGLSLALTQEHPVFGKSQSAIFDLSSSDYMETTVSTSDGVFSYQLEKTKKGSVKRTMDVPLEGRLWEGSDIIGLSSSDLWKSTPAVFINKLIDLTGFEQKDPKKILADLVEEYPVKMKSFSEWVNRRHVSIDDLLKGLREMMNSAKAVYDFTEASLKGIDVDNVDTTINGDLEEIHDRLNKIRDERKTVSVKLQGIEGLYELRQRLYADLTFEEYESGLRQEIEKKKVFIKSQKKLNEEAENEIDCLRKISVEITNETRIKDKKLAVLNEKISTAKETVRQLKGNDSCPLCGSTSKDHFEKELARLKEELESNTKEAKKISTQIQKLVEKDLSNEKVLGKIVRVDVGGEIVKLEYLEDRLENRLAEASKAFQEEVSVETIMNLEQELTSLEESEEKLVQIIEQFRKGVDLKRKYDDGMASCRIAKENIGSIEEMVKAVKALKVEMVKELILSLIDKANAVLEGTTIRLRYSDEDGLTSDRGVKMKGLSGAEYSIVSTAMVFALNARLIVLDEVDRIDSKGKERLVANFLKNNSDQRQLILVGVNKPPSNIEHLVTPIEVVG